MPYVSGYSTEMTADDLIAGLIALYDGEIIDQYGKPAVWAPITIESDVGKKATLIVRVAESSDPHRLNADRSHIIRCLTTDGYSVDFLIPPDSERVENILGAYVMVDPDWPGRSSPLPKP